MNFQGNSHMDSSSRSGVAALLKPQSIAIVGASPRDDSLSGRPLSNLLAQGYQGKIFPVNPRYETIGDLRCYSDLLALDEAPDVVLVLVGIDRVFATLDQCLKIGAKTAILFAGGFAEAGVAGVELQSRLKSYAAQGLRICGPNCNGIFNVAGKIAMGFSPAFETPARRGRTALISQSGAIATGVSSRAMEMGVGFSHIIATGNEADLEIADFVDYLLDDPDTDCFALFVEGLKNPARFLRLAEKALEHGKPIIALKAGRSAAGQQVALSHTGAMAGSYDILMGALQQRGVQIVSELGDLAGLASIFATGRRASNKALAVASLSGGMAALIADQCDAASMPLAEFGDETRTALGALLPGFANLANPLDVTGQAVNQPALWTGCLNSINKDAQVDAVLSILTITARQTERNFAEDIAAAARAPGPLQLCLWTSSAPAGSGAEILREAGVPLFLRAEDAIRATGAWRHYWTTREQRLGALRRGAQISASIPAIDAPLESGWAMLAEAGIPIARQFLAQDRAALTGALTGFRFPVAVKVESRAIAHKTELGLVRLGVSSIAEAVQCFDDMTGIVQARLPGTKIDGILVQEMIRGRRETILGIRQEAGLAPAIVLGIGGIFSEIIGDIAIRLAPLTPFDVQEMIGELRMHEIFGGVRGLAPVDMHRFTDLIVKFSHLVMRWKDSVAEFEINPLIIADDGASATAVDVLVGWQAGAGEL